MRPDQGGAIIYLSKLNWNNLQVDVAVPTGEQIPQATLDWLIAFSGQHKRPLIFMTQLMKDGQYINKQSMTGVGPPAFQQQLVEWSRNGETVI